VIEPVTAEIIWALKYIASNFSFSSSNGTVELFKIMFPEAIPKGFSRSCSNICYLVSDALGLYFHQQLLKDLENEYFSIICDETTNSEGKKELQVLVRYYSSNHNKVVTQHFQTFFIGKATADVLCNNIVMCH